MNENAPIRRGPDDARQKIADLVKLKAKGLSIHELLRGMSDRARKLRAELVAEAQKDTKWTPQAISMHLGIELPATKAAPKAPPSRPSLRVVPPAEPAPSARAVFEGVRAMFSKETVITPAMVRKALERALPRDAGAVRVELDSGGRVHVEIGGKSMGCVVPLPAPVAPAPRAPRPQAVERTDPAPVRSIRPAPETPARKTIKQAAREFAEATAAPIVNIGIDLSKAIPVTRPTEIVRVEVPPEDDAFARVPSTDWRHLARAYDEAQAKLDATIVPPGVFAPPEHGWDVTIVAPPEAVEGGARLVEEFDALVADCDAEASRGMLPIPPLGPDDRVALSNGPEVRTGGVPVCAPVLAIAEPDADELPIPDMAAIARVGMKADVRREIESLVDGTRRGDPLCVPTHIGKLGYAMHAARTGEEVTIARAPWKSGAGAAWDGPAMTDPVGPIHRMMDQPLPVPARELVDASRSWDEATRGDAPVTREVTWTDRVAHDMIKAPSLAQAEPWKSGGAAVTGMDLAAPGSERTVLWVCEFGKPPRAATPEEERCFEDGKVQGQQIGGAQVMSGARRGLSEEEYARLLKSIDETPITVAPPDEQLAALRLEIATLRGERDVARAQLREREKTLRTVAALCRLDLDDLNHPESPDSSKR